MHAQRSVIFRFGCWVRLLHQVARQELGRALHAVPEAASGLRPVVCELMGAHAGAAIMHLSRARRKRAQLGQGSALLVCVMVAARG